MRTPSFAAAVVAALSFTSSVSTASIDEKAKRAAEEAQASSRANAVTQAFRIAWEGYYKYAFPNDQLHPIDNGNDNN